MSQHRPHQRDQLRLLTALEALRNAGNTVIVVEHDPLTMSRADHLVEVGPGAGVEGGNIIASMSRGRFFRSKSLTAKYLRGELGVQIPQQRRTNTKELRVIGARCNN